MEIGIKITIVVFFCLKKCVRKCINVLVILIGLKGTVKFWKLRGAGRSPKATAERRAIGKIRWIFKPSKLEEIRHL